MAHWHAFPVPSAEEAVAPAGQVPTEAALWRSRRHAAEHAEWAARLDLEGRWSQVCHSAGQAV